MNVKPMLAALRGVAAYQDILTQPVMERALSLLACAAHGGRLTAQNLPRGARFRFTLPLEQEGWEE